MIVIGEIRFQGRFLDVYNSVDEPWFLAVDVAKMIDYSVGKAHQMLDVVDQSEMMVDTLYRSSKNKTYVVCNRIRTISNFNAIA